MMPNNKMFIYTSDTESVYIRFLGNRPDYISFDKSTLLHRVNGPAVLSYDYSKKSLLQWWYKEGKLHREDGPAFVDMDGSKYYYMHGLLHRENGPAVEYADGRKLYYINNKQLTENEFSLHYIKWAFGKVSRGEDIF
jgi:hypothetical protein